MAIADEADESENFPDHSTARITPKGWRVISNPIRQPHSEADELKTLIQTIQQRHQRTQGKRKLEETEPPEAA
jgi:hypothetical protein